MLNENLSTSRPCALVHDMNQDMQTMGQSGFSSPEMVHGNSPLHLKMTFAAQRASVGTTPTDRVVNGLVKVVGE